MIKHQSQVRGPFRQGGRRGQLVRQHQEVVAQAALGNLVQAAPHIHAQQPLWIGLGLHQVPDPDQQPPARKGP